MTREKLKTYLRYVILVSILNIAVIPILYFLFGVANSFNFIALLVLISSYIILLANVHICTTTLNMLGYRCRVCSPFSLTTNIVSLISSLILVVYVAADATNWILGVLLSNFILVIISRKILLGKLNPTKPVYDVSTNDGLRDYLNPKLLKEFLFL